MARRWAPAPVASISKASRASTRGFRTAAAALAMAWLVAGCVVIPVHHQVIAGRAMSRPMLGFMRVGETPRDSVLAALGPPVFEFPDIRVIAYSWQVLHARAPWVVPFGTAGVQDLAHYEVLSIAFDDSDRVLAYDFGPRKGGTIRSHALRWIERAHLDVPRPVAGFTDPPVPSGEARLYVYRRGGLKDAPLPYEPEVSVDGKRVAELRKHGFVSVLLSPGPHVVLVDPVPDQTLKHMPEDQRPMRQFTIEAVADTVYYLELWVRHGFGALDPAFQLRTPAKAKPVLRKMRPTW
jgi:hypothetical protein